MFYQSCQAGLRQIIMNQVGDIVFKENVSSSNVPELLMDKKILHEFL